MYASYIARTGKQLHAFYHRAEDGLCRRVYENGRWGRAISLSVDAQPGFHVSLGESGFHILYRDGGGLRLAVWDAAGGYAVKTLPEHGECRGYEAVPSAKGTRILYESVSEDGLRLMSRLMETKGAFSEPEELDIIEPLGAFSFRAQTVRDDHAVVFYQSKTGPRLGYREVVSRASGDFKHVHVAARIVGLSCLTTEEAIHLLYIIRGITGSRLIYRKRHKTGLTAAVTVWEGRVDDCHLFIIRDKTYACFMSGGSPYLCESADGGASFRRAVRFRNKFCETPVKAALLSDQPLKEEEFAAHEVYVDSLNPWDAQMLPELYEDFYPAFTAAPAANGHVTVSAETAEAEGLPSQAAPVSSKPADEKPVRRPETKLTEADLYYGADLPEEAKLRNQLEMLERKLAEKDRQILGMNALKRELESQGKIIERLYREKDDAEKRASGGNETINKNSPEIS